MEDVDKQKCKIYVPAEGLAVYKRRPIWRDFAFIRVMGEPVWVEELILNETELTMQQGTTFQLTAEVVPDDAANKWLLWASSDVRSVVANKNGLLTAKDVGKAKVTVRSADGHASADCAVTVVSDAGIEEVVANADGDVEVYNLMGVKVADSPENLPAGLYLVNGRKVLVR